MSYELFISLRYLRSRRTQKFISLITWISIGGVAVGVMALIIVIAVMSGFGQNLRDKILGTNSHVAVTHGMDGSIANYEAIVREAEKTPDVAAASPFIMNQVMLVHEDRVAGVVVRGVDPQRAAAVSDIGKNIVQGKLADLDTPPATENEPALDGIVIGKELTHRLGVNPGDTLSMVSPVSRITPMGLVPKINMVRVVGLFDSGMYEYDSSLAFISLATAQRFFSMKGRVTGVEIRVNDIYKAADVADSLQKTLRFPYLVRDWMRLNKNLFSALRMEKITMFIILVLIILVAAFNIISTLFMVVMEKNKDIAILKAMGASRSSIMRVFSMQGLIIGVAGTLFGCLGGFTVVPNLNEIVAVVEHVFGVKVFPSDVYFLNRLPSEIQWADSLVIVAFSIGICYVASLYPAWRASRLDPVDGLRYE